MINELKTESDLLLKQKTEEVKLSTEEIELIKLKIRDERKVRREWEEKLEEADANRITLGMKLNEVGKLVESSKTLEFTSTDFDKEVMNS